MPNLLKFDELNILVNEKFLEGEEALLDYAEELLILGYITGFSDTEDMLDYQLDNGVSITDLGKSIDKKIDGKTYADRIREYALVGDVNAITKVILNDHHRTLCEGGYDSAKAIERESGLVIKKTWNTMEDDRVRNPHWYMQGQTVGLDDYFSTYNGELALHPCGFGIPDLDIGCRCWIEYSLSEI